MGISSSDAPNVSPAPILEASFAFAHTRILAAAVELGIFTAIAHGWSSVETIAEETKCSVRGLRILLDGLVGLHYLGKEGDRYILTPLTATYLSRTSPLYLGGYVLFVNKGQSDWEPLAEIVRNGRPVRGIESEEDRGEFFSQLVDSLYVANLAAAELAAQALTASSLASIRAVLDVGAGSGVWSIAIAKRSPLAQVTVADWPVVIERVTKQFAAREEVADRFEYLPGNFRDADFGESRFDVTILGHVCHSEGAAQTQTLFGRLHRALRTGGQLLIAEIIPDDARQQAAFPLLFAVNMLVKTEEGDTFTLSEYRQWLEAAGFRDVRTLEAPSPSPLILASK